MFVIAVLAFAAGIYLETTYTVPYRHVLSVTLGSVAFCCLFYRKIPHLSLFIVIAAFSLAGMTRLAPTVATYPVSSAQEFDLYEGTVIESGRNTKIIELASPLELHKVKALFRAQEPLVIGSRIRLFGQLREIVPTFNNPYITTWKWLKKMEGVQYEIKGTITSVLPAGNYIETVRSWLKNRVEASGAPEGPIILALTIGDRTGIDDSTTELFLRTGTSHILAISGFQVAIVSGFIFFLFRGLFARRASLRLSGRDKKYAALFTIPFPFLFMLLAGSGPSIVRATIMITVFMISVLIERERDIINTIFLSALIILLIYPHSLFMPSFQLSFVSVLSIVLITQRVYPLLRSRGAVTAWFLTSIITTLAATVGTLPVVLHHFYGINPFCVLHNLVSIPLMCLAATPLSFAGMVLPLGGHLLTVAGWITDLNLNLLRWLDFGYIFPVIRPNLTEILLFYGLMAGLVSLHLKLARMVIIFVLVPIVSTYLAFALAERFHDRLCVDFIDVGLGDAILVEAPGGIRILVDGGGSFRGDYDMGKAVIAPILLSKKILTLDCVVNTHPHGDHIGGLSYDLSLFIVKSFVT